MLKLLLDKGASPNYDYRMRINPSPLMFAIHLHRTEAVRLMLEFDNSEINMTSDDNIFHSLPPLTYAVYREHLDIVQLFFRHGANPNEPSIECMRLPLHIAVSGPAPDLTIIRELLDHGASPDFATDLGDNLLHNIIREHYRSRTMRFDVLLLLLQYGMDLSVEDRDRLTGCWRALIRYDFPTCRLLLEAGSPSNNGVRAYLKITTNFIRIEAEQHPDNYLPPETHILHWFEERLSNPRTLSDICCIAIRKRLGRRLTKAVSLLYLPKQLEYTLLFKYLTYLRQLFSKGSLDFIYKHDLWNMA
jgi:ankyrin repeat protein